MVAGARIEIVPTDERANVCHEPALLGKPHYLSEVQTMSKNDPGNQAAAKAENDSVEEHNEESIDTPNPFDPASLRISEKDTQELGVEIAIVELPCRKPRKQEWVRAHREHFLDVLLFKMEDTGEHYLVSDAMRNDSDLFEMARPTRIRLAVTRAGSPFLWPVPLPIDLSAGASWHRSGLQCQGIAIDRWVRVTADHAASAYQPRTTTANLPNPVWPKQSLAQLLELSFRARFIDSPDHPILRLLRGEE